MQAKTTIQTADNIGFIKLHYTMSNLFVGKQRHILPFAGQELCTPQVSIVPLKMYSYYVQSDHDAVVRQVIIESDSCCCLTGFKFPGNKDWYVVNSNQGNHLENLHVVLQCVFLTDYEQVGIQGLLT